jgi:hypothetical protein
VGEVTNMRVLNALRNYLIAEIFVLVLAAFVTPALVSAQDTGRSNAVVDLTKAVLFDPTTYAPAGLSYASQRMDWKTSQVLFSAGWLEHNSRYTVSGRADDVPVGYEAGNRQIRRDALAHLQESLVNNFSTQLFERALSQKYPEHAKLFKTLSWVERISFSSYVGYLASVDHFKQVQRNEQMAHEYGLR